MLRKMFTKVLLLLTASVFLCSCNVFAADITLAGKITLKPNESWNKDISREIKPRESERIYILFKARINVASFTHGSADAFRLSLNGVPIGIDRLANKKNSYYIDNTRQVLWYSPRDEMFRALYDPFDKKFPPQWGVSHDYAFDITNLFQKNSANKLVIEYGFDGVPNTVFDIQDCQIVVSKAIQPGQYPEKPLPYHLSQGFNWARKLASSLHKGINLKLDVPGSDDEPIIISSPSALTLFKASANSDKGMTAAVKFPNWKEIPISTAIGTPGEGWEKANDFPSLYQGDNTWQTPQYRLQRRNIPDPNGIIIEDRVTNLTPHDLPIAILYQIDVGDPTQLKEFRLGGVPRQQFYAKTEPGGSTSNSPVGYVRDNKRAYAFVMEDEALRSNGSIMAWDNQLSFGTDMFYLQPNSTHTFRFRIVGAASMNYFEILNRIRAAWNNYQTIPGLFGFVYPSGLDKDNLKDASRVKHFFEDTGITIPVVPPAVPTSKGEKRFVYGSGPSQRIKDGINAEIRPLSKLMDEAGIDLPLSFYFDINLLRTDDISKIPDEFADATVWDELGNPKEYRPGWLHVILPTTENKIGKREMENIKTYFETPRVRGIFLDEWNHSIGRLDFGHSDGMTATLNEDLTIQSKIGYVPKLTKQFRHQVIRYLHQEKDAMIFANSGVVFTDEQSEPIIHLGEPTQYSHLYKYQLFNTPLALNLKRTRGVWNDTYEYLKYGVLLCYYARRLNGDHLLKYVYPIKVLSVEEGVVIGEDKIITLRDGTYSFQNNKPVEALIFSAPSGKLERKVQGSITKGKNVINLNLDENKQEIALIRTTGEKMLLHK